MSSQIAFAVLLHRFRTDRASGSNLTAIAVADRIVRPIRLLISAADNVASGNMNDAGAGARGSMATSAACRAPSTR